MRLTKLAVAAIAATVAYGAHALEPTHNSPDDYRIKHVDYKPLDTVRINCVIGLTTLITIEPGEKYVTHAFGDPGAWTLSQNGNHIFIWPKVVNGDTNLEIVTDRRVYHLLLHFVGARGAGEDGNTKAGFITTPWTMPQATVSLTYNYPYDEQQAGDRKRAMQAVKDALANGETQGQANVSYQRSADPAMQDIAPVNVWDNYRFTSFKFLPNAELPTVFVVGANGKESAVNVHVEGANHNIIVAQMVAREWRVRLGDRVIGIRNDDFNPALGANPTGTVSPDVKRVMKQNNDGDAQ